MKKLKKIISEIRNQAILYENILIFEKGLKALFQKLKMKEVELIILDNHNKEKHQTLISNFYKNPQILFLERNNKPIFLISRFLKIMKLDSQEIKIPLFLSQKDLLGIFILRNNSLRRFYFKKEVKILKEFKSFLELKLIRILYNDNLENVVLEKTEKLKMRNEELLKSYKKLEELGKSKDEFLSIASHELRTPMTIINGFTEFLLSEKFGQINAKQRNFLDIVSKNTVELIQLVNKMLDINKLEDCKMEFEWREISFPSFLEELTKEFKIMCSKKKIELFFRNPQKISLFIKSDPFKLKQVLTNLVRNAYKFTPKNGRIEILLEAVPQNSKFLQISVSDNGAGIPLYQQKMIFEKFYQIGNYLHRNYAGTGLGLSIVKLLVEKLGGTIEVKSSKGKGACFTFSLPKKR